MTTSCSEKSSKNNDAKSVKIESSSNLSSVSEHGTFDDPKSEDYNYKFYFSDAQKHIHAFETISDEDKKYYYFLSDLYNYNDEIMFNVETQKNGNKNVKVYINKTLVITHKLDNYYKGDIGVGLIQPNLAKHEEYITVFEEGSPSINDKCTIYKKDNTNKYTAYFSDNIGEITSFGKIGSYNNSLGLNKFFAVYFDFESGKYVKNKEIIGKNYNVNLGYNGNLIFNKEENIVYIDKSNKTNKEILAENKNILKILKPNESYTITDVSWGEDKNGATFKGNVKIRTEDGTEGWIGNLHHYPTD